jgi:hypothetical protein
MTREHSTDESAEVVQEPIVKPEVTFLSDVLAEIEKGTIRIPKFHREYVWRPSDMLDLFDSILKGYPIGSLLLWETAAAYESRPKVGPLPIRPAKKGELLAYALDGQQRLTTLFGALRLPENFPQSDDPESWRWWIFYDLQERKFTHWTRWPDTKPPAHYLPLRTVFRTVDFLKFARELSKQKPATSTAGIEAAEEVVRRISGYRMALIRIREGSLEQAVEIFSRLNTKGPPMKPDEMISALTYREDAGGFHLAAKVDEIVDELTPLGFGTFDRTLIFRSIAAQSGEGASRTGWEALAKKIGPSLPSIAATTQRGLLAGAEFLLNHLSVPGTSYLPYGYQLVCLGRFFAELKKTEQGPLDHEKERWLKTWFWWTSFSSWFAGANSTKNKQALDAMRDLARAPDEAAIKACLAPFQDELHPRPLPSRFDLHSARVRTLLLVMMNSRKPLGLDGREVDFLREPPTAVRYGLPYVFRSQNLPADLHGHPANRLLLPRQNNLYALTQLQRLREPLRSQVFESQFISPRAAEYLESSRGQEFITQRRTDLLTMEQAFMQQHNIPLPTKTDEAPIEDSDAEEM